MFRSIFNTFGNCVKIPELKSRILFTLGVLAVVPADCLDPYSGSERHGVAGLFRHPFTRRRPAGDVEHVCRRRDGTLRHRNARHHAVHQRDDHHPVAHGGLAEIEQAGARRRRPLKNHPIRTLSHGVAVSGTGIVLRRRLGKSRQIVSGTSRFRWFSTKVTSGGIASRRC